MWHRKAAQRRFRFGTASPFPNSAGFTLIELLVVIAIIGILAMIAMRQFTEYRQRSLDARANADLRNAATAEEAYFATHRIYKSGSDIGPGFSSFLPGLMVSKEVSLQMSANGNVSFTGTAATNQGTKIYTYDSDLGGLQ